MNPSWSHFTKRIPVYTSVDRLYKAWTTRLGLESWFLRQALFLGPNGKLRHPEEMAQRGDRYIWLWHGWPDDVTEHREVVDVNGVNFLQFQFTGDCRVSVTIREEQDAALCELVQEGIPLEDDPARNLFVGCGEGWTFYLSNLKSILEGGIDLRNKNMFIKGVINS
jgi:uncharacterized protein YndB with AHSA1/START domain